MVEISGMTEFVAEIVPNDDVWYKTTILIKHSKDGVVSVKPLRMIERNSIYEAYGELWYSDENDELVIIK